MIGLRRLKLKLLSWRASLLPSLFTSVLVAMTAFIVRYICVTHFYIDLFDIISNTYESFIFYSGLGGFRFIIRELLDTLFLKMNANPNPGGGAANPNPGGGAANPNPGGGAANPNPGGGAANPNPGGGAGSSWVNHRDLPVPDPTGIANRPFNRNDTSQPYAEYLANRLDLIRVRNGGRQSPAFNGYLTAKDREWAESYLMSLGRNPALAHNSPKFCKQLRELP